MYLRPQIGIVGVTRMSRKLKRAVFLDRDGVLIGLLRGNEAYGLLYKKEDCRVIPGVPEALMALKNKGMLLVVVTNQPVVARGLASIEEVAQYNDYINEQTGGIIDRFYFCPHHPEMHDDVPEHAKKFRIACVCRKPGKGMLLQAARDFGIDLNKSWMIGDSITDIAAGKSAGCKTILIHSPSNNRVNISSTPFDPDIQSDYKAQDLSEAVSLVK